MPPILQYERKYEYNLYDLHVRGIEGLSSLEGIQIFWILFWVSSLGIPLGWRNISKKTGRKKKTPAPEIPKMWFSLEKINKKLRNKMIFFVNVLL